ncbi:adenine specific DNA methyltransferase [Candidatus Accumulibacter phosphatis]|uniref:site-specific DNA-methyltransferase (adenine-specific) n=1 Tax=Candidatus Accumulibacter phosphatis TaxID=327160 RepID=A0A5S4EKB5_9PROT|nr:adenine specific DNA methyltransferase [Candidatus Accumulibacter phosphatis]
MTEEQRRRLRAVKTFAQLISFLRDELDWPIDQGHDEDDLTFDWSDDLGLKDEERVGIKEIKQLRPLETGQPWGIFFVNFEKKHLPIVILRRILNALVLKKRASANRAQQAAWQQHDLLFISAYGQENERQLTFAHFSEPTSDFDPSKATLRVLGWDDDDTSLKLDYVADTLKAKLTWPSDTADLKDWRQRWSEAFELRHREVIDTAADLALRLADLAKRIRNRMLLVLPRESESGELRKLLKGFQAALIHDLNEARFADMYAQTITYGLFSAAVSRTVPGAGTAVHQGNVVDMVPVTNPFLREMLSSFLKAGGRRGKLDFDELGIQEVVDLLNDPKTHMDAVLRDFGNRTRGEDPVIHFYEEFLKAYDKQLKVQRGVFYTPQPVVSYIVRSVHELLQTEFGLVDGLADTTTWGEMLKKHPGLKLPPLTDEPGEKRTISPDEPFVQILDPATGTATFLVEVIDVIYRTLKANWKQQRLTVGQQQIAWNDYVPKHLLPRLHAFELMMAPYAIAHMKIGLKLAETGYRFGTEERARIYLTNALEPCVKQLPLIGFEALAHEAAAVNEIKRQKRFTVVIGNPPYAKSSGNRGEAAERLVRGYKDMVAGETNVQPLSDDYVKFIAYAQEASISSRSVVGMVTNIPCAVTIESSGRFGSSGSIGTVAPWRGWCGYLASSVRWPS